jgi:hypothetical protein
MKSDLKIRTKDYALSVIRLFAELPKKTETQIMRGQLRLISTFREFSKRGSSPPNFYFRNGLNGAKRLNGLNVLNGLSYVELFNI